MNTYLITYDLFNPGKKYDELGTAIRSLGNYCKPLLSTWLVRSNLSCAQIRDSLSPHVDSNDKIFVAEFGDKWASWKLATDDVTWLKSGV